MYVVFQTMVSRVVIFADVNHCSFSLRPIPFILWGGLSHHINVPYIPAEITILSISLTLLESLLFSHSVEIQLAGKGRISAYTKHNNETSSMKIQGKEAYKPLMKYVLHND